MENKGRLIRSLTPARIALGRNGFSVPLTEQLAFKQAHAMARDAVFTRLDKTKIEQGIRSLGLSAIEVQSRIQDRKEYLLRPDLGRVLDPLSEKKLEEECSGQNDICLIIADGLSADAANHFAIPVVKYLLLELEKLSLKTSSICMAEQARVALGDEIAFRLKSRVCLLLIGERPGLTAANSLGAYLTYDPRPGRSDAERNCISNIGQGLSPEIAAKKLAHLISESIRVKLSGVLLKDNFLYDRDLPGSNH